MSNKNSGMSDEEYAEYLRKYGNSLSSFLRSAYPRPVFRYEEGSDDFLDALIETFDELSPEVKKTLEPYTFISSVKGPSHTDMKRKIIFLAEDDDIGGRATLLREVAKINSVTRRRRNHSRR